MLLLGQALQYPCEAVQDWLPALRTQQSFTSAMFHYTCIFSDINKLFAVAWRVSLPLVARCLHALRIRTHLYHYMIIYCRRAAYSAIMAVLRCVINTAIAYARRCEVMTLVQNLQNLGLQEIKREGEHLYSLIFFCACAPVDAHRPLHCGSQP